MKFKLLSVLLLCVFIVPIISSCNYINFNTEDLMNPPKPSDELYDIQQALETSVKGSIQLKYPTTGENRSAFTKIDLDGDKVDEVVAFYMPSSTVQNLTIHIGIIAFQDDKWIHAGDIPVSASDVEALSFSDMNADGRLEIIVGWAMYGEVDRMVCAYTFGQSKLTSRLAEPYTKFTTCDLNANGRDELLIIYQNLLEKTSSAKLFELSDDTTVDLGTARMDNDITGYSNPIKVAGENGTEAVYIDANKAGGMITEVLVYDETLKNVCIAAGEKSNLETFRPSPVSVYDINGDSIPAIPSQTLFFPQDDRIGTDAVFLTNWLSFRNGEFQKEISALMNYSDGYYLALPENWSGNVTVLRNTEQRSRTFVAWDKKLQAPSTELLKLQVVAKSDYDAAPQNFGNILLAERDGYVYLGTVAANNNRLDITEAQLRELFFLF